MINKFLRDRFTVSIIALALLFPFLALFFSSIINPSTVSAYTTSSDFPDTNYSNLDSYVSSEILSQFYNDFYDNSSIQNLGLSKENSMFFLTYDTSANTYYFYACLPQTFVAVGNGCICPFGGSGTSLWGVYSHLSPSQLDTVSSIEFTRTDYNLTGSATYKPVFCFDSNLNNYYRCQVRLWYSGVFGSICELEPSYNPPTNPYTNYPSAFLYNYSEPYFPEFETNNAYLHIDTDDFYDWLVNNDKIALDSSGNISGKIPSYIGISKLKSFIDFYKSFGSSNSGFLNNIVSWFSHMNIISQSRENIRILKSITDNLYAEYLDYLSSSHAYWPTATKIEKRHEIDTVTDDDNLTLVTDDSSDTLDISILRDILRGVIAVSNNIIKGTGDILGAISRLDFTVNVANNGGASLDFDVNSIWGTGDITQSENYLALTNAFMDKGVDVSAAENMKINYLDNATQADSFTVSVVMPDQFVNGQFTEKTVSHTIDNTSKMYNTLILFRKLIAFAVVAYFAIRIRFELPHLIRGE